MTQKGYTEVQAKNAIYSGGLRIYTTQDARIQRIMDEEYQNPENFPEGTQIALDWALTLKHKDGTIENYSQEMLQKYYRDQGDETFDLLFDTQEEAQAAADGYKAAVMKDGDTIQGERITFTPEPQSSMVIIDQYTGYVKGLIGGRGTKTASLTLNRATDTYRQPGSTFKILSTYGPAIDNDEITLATIVADEPYTYENSGKTVKNSDGEYHGDVSIRTAIENSYNVVAVKTLTELGIRTGFQYLQRMGFDGLSEKNDMYQPLALGGVSKGVTTLQLAAAYAAIANKGTYLTPVLYTKVLDQDGNVILDNTPVETHIFKESTAFLLTSAMEDVVNYGTGTMCRLDNMTVAGKTGTTSSYKDLVFAGFTPYYTCAVWAGYDNNITVPKNAQSFHKVLWQSVMNRIHEDLPDIEFERPSTVKAATICSETGLLAGSGCPRATEYFDLETVPTRRCTQHYIAPTPEPTPEPTDTPTPGEPGGTTDTPTTEPTDTPDTPTDEPETDDPDDNWWDW